MPELQLDDITLHYEVDGNGPPLILIAGMLSDSASWGPLVPLLTPHFTVIRPDNRTTGRTRPWDAPVSIAEVARDAMALMEHLGHARYHVVGHSMGGLVGMELAGMQPQVVSSLAILASSRQRAPQTVAIFDTLLEIRRGTDDPALWLKALYPWAFRPEFFEDPANTEAALAAALAYPHGQSADAMAHQIESLRAFKPQIGPDQITAPTLVLLAQHDILIPRVGTAKGFAKIADVTVKEIEGAGHSLHWDAPAAVADHLIGFAGRRSV